MNQPHEPATNATTTEELTTAQLANAGGPDPETAEPRTFDDDRDPDLAQADASGDSTLPLLAEDESEELRRSWDAIQAAFVDEPRRAVEDADQLVAQAMQRLAETFAERRSRLESQWDSGDRVSTEDLRVALQRYRAFFGRLLAV